MSEIAIPAIEGKVLEREGTTVGELIEELQELDPKLLVFTTGCCYGPEAEIGPREVVLGEHDLGSHEMKKLGVKPGDYVVFID